MISQNPLINDGPLRVLQFTASTRLGGTELMLYNLVKHNVSGNLKHDFLILLNDEGPMPEMYESLGSDVTLLNWNKRRNKIQVFKDIRQAILDGCYDIVIAYGLRTNILTRLACVGLPAIAVGGLRSLYGTDTPSKIYDAMDRATFGLCAGYISNSKMAIKRYTDIGFPSEKFFLLYNGVLVQRFRANKCWRKTIRQELRIASDDIVIISVANLRPVKNHSLQIRAMRNLANINSKAVLLIVGTGPERDNIEKLATDLNVVQNVRFLEERHDIPELLAAADIMIMTSIWEGIPNSIGEAMASEIPVITTDVGCIHEIITDGEEGYLVPLDNETMLSNRLIQLCSDATLRHEMGLRGRKRILETRSFDKFVTEFESIIENIANRKNDNYSAY